jgi:hypothetical protein
MWCEKCQRGISGKEGQACPECLSRKELSPGILKSPEQAEADHLALARARKLSSQNKKMVAYKSNEDIKREAKEEAVAEVLAKIASGEITIPNAPKFDTGKSETKQTKKASS